MVTGGRLGDERLGGRGPDVVAADVAVIDRQTTVTPPRDRIRWGPVLAGLIAAIAMLFVLSVLGLAIGLSAFEVTSDGSDVGSAAAIWGAVIGLIAFFFGGWVTGRTAAIFKDENALLNGFMVAATALALILWLTSTGVGNLLGGIGSNVADIARVGTEQVQSGRVDPNQAQGAAADAAAQARQAAVESYDEARDGAWGTLLGLVLAIGAAMAGSFLGHRMKSNVENEMTDAVAR